jgi:predicted metal-dependent hydrolase
MNLFRTARYAAGDLIEVAGARVRLKVSPRASRVSLRFDTTRREVIATAPTPRRLGEAVAFAGQKAEWISAQLRALPAPWSLEPGGDLEILGQVHRLAPAANRLQAGFGRDMEGRPVLRAFGQDDAFGRAAVRLLRRRALEVFTERTALHAASFDCATPKVAVMDARARWGSCRPARPGLKGDLGSIRYSWRLVLAPFEVADYVAVHECAHLVEANHGPDFWALVRQLHGSERPARAWLRQHGARLHAFGREG